MTTVINSYQNTTLTISDRETYVIAPNGVIENFTGVAFSAGSERSKLVVLGTIVGDNLGIIGNIDDLSVTVGQSGSVIGATAVGDGLFFDGNNIVLAIDGSVIANDSGVVARGANTTITVGANGFVQGGSNPQLTNNFFPAAAAMRVSGDGSVLRNAGTILADENTTFGAQVAVVNDARNDDPPNGFRSDSDLDFTFVNTGVVIGDVLMAAGEDLYNARNGGIVEGLIDMGADNDTLWGGAGADSAVGGDGDDTMHGGAGQDTLLGSGGRDLVSGGAGNDSLVGGSGFDTLIGNGGEDTLLGGTGDDVARGGSGDDRLIGSSGNDTLIGQSGRDFLRGDGGDDSLEGGRDDDTLEGNAGLDTLRGGSGDDQLNGGTDADLLVGGAGNDTLIGGNGADIYDFDNAFGQDVIEDFSGWALEKIDLSDVASVVSFADLTSDHATQSGSDTIIDAGNGNTITLLNFNLAALDANDFLF